MYALGTSFRFGAEVRPCAVCQAEASDSQQHYVCSAFARRAGRDWVGRFPPLPSDASATALLIRMLRAGGIDATRAASWIGALCTAMHASRPGAHEERWLPGFRGWCTGTSSARHRRP